MAVLVYWLRRRKREGKPVLLDPGLFAYRSYSVGVCQIFLQQVALGGMLIALPIYLQLVWGYNALEAGVTLAPLSLTMFGVALLAARRAGRRRPASIVRAGFVLLAASIVILIPLVPTADSGWTLVIPLALAGAGLGAAQGTRGRPARRHPGRDPQHQHRRPPSLSSGRPGRHRLAALTGVVNAFRMMRLPDPQPSAAVEGAVLG